MAPLADSTPTFAGQAAYAFVPFDTVALSVGVDYCNAAVFNVNGQDVKLPAMITGKCLVGLGGWIGDSESTFLKLDPAGSFKCLGLSGPLNGAHGIGRNQSKCFITVA